MIRTYSQCLTSQCSENPITDIFLRNSWISRTLIFPTHDGSFCSKKCYIIIDSLLKAFIFKIPWANSYLFLKLFTKWVLLTRFLGFFMKIFFMDYIRSEFHIDFRTHCVIMTQRIIIFYTPWNALCSSEESVQIKNFKHHTFIGLCSLFTRFNMRVLNLCHR